MKKILFVVFVIFTSAIMLRMAISNRPVQAAAVQFVPTNTEYLSPTAQPTRTDVPSPTIGYQDTAVVAQQTAMEAVRVNAQITAEHEQMILSQLQLTADIEMQDFQMQSWTATAALTSIPLTMTQQYHHNTQVANSQNIIAGQLTSTHQAPTQMAALAMIETNRDFAKVDRVFRIGFLIVMGIFLLSISVFVLRWQPPVQIDEPEPEPESPFGTVVSLKKDYGQGNFGLERLVIPCTPEQLTELAIEITGNRKTLAINQWEGSGTLFTRPVILNVRSWMQMQDPKFAIATDDGQLTPTPLGLAFLVGWIESQSLPSDYQFAEATE
jgi:hypothetical protein